MCEANLHLLSVTRSYDTDKATLVYPGHRSAPFGTVMIRYLGSSLLENKRTLLHRAMFCSSWRLAFTCPRILTFSVRALLSLSRLLTKPLQLTSTERAPCQARTSRRRRSRTCLRKALRGVGLRTSLMRRQKDGTSIVFLPVRE